MVFLCMFQTIGRAGMATTRRRAMLYMPGSNAKMLAKAPTLGADSVCLDLEDAVASNKKVEARSNIVTALKADFGRTEKLVRINAVGSGFEKDDLHHVLSGEALPAGIGESPVCLWVGLLGSLTSGCLSVLPKVESKSHLHWACTTITQLLGERGAFARCLHACSASACIVRALAGKQIKLIALIESAKALLQLGDITQGSPRLDALIFGADDYASTVEATYAAVLLSFFGH